MGHGPWSLGELDMTKNILRASHVALVVKKSPASVGDIRDAGSISGSGRSSGE